MQLAVESDWTQLLLLLLFLLFSLLGRILNWLTKRRGVPGESEPSAQSSAQTSVQSSVQTSGSEWLEEYFDAVEVDGEEPGAWEEAADPIGVSRDPLQSGSSPVPPVSRPPEIESLVSISDFKQWIPSFEREALGGDSDRGFVWGAKDVDESEEWSGSRNESLRSAMLWFHILGAPVSLRDPGAPDAPVGLR